MAFLEDYSGMVLTHGALSSLLADYRAPNFKIHSLLKEKRLIGLKKGLYVVAPSAKNQLISLPLVANHLYGPSYVSLEFALSYYGIIPESVVEVTSVATKRSKSYETPLGRFTYQRLPSSYFSIGITQIRTSDKISYMFASPEKALCDWLVLTPNLRIHSSKGLATLLLEDMRMDEQELHNLDLNLIARISNSGFRSSRLKFLTSCLKALQPCQ